MNCCAIAPTRSGLLSISRSRNGLMGTPFQGLPHPRRGPTPLRRTLPAPAAAAAPPPPVEQVWKPTGVPLVDDLASFATITESGIHAAKLIAIALVATVLGTIIIRTVAAKADDEAHKTSFNPIRAVLGAISAPSAALLPLYTAVYSATVVSSLVQVAAAKASAQFNSLCFGNGPAVMKVIKSITQLVQDATEVIVVIAAAWTVIEVKDRFFATLERTAFKNNDGLARLAGTFSSLMNYLIYAGGALAALSSVGINITPLLASVGASSVVIGLAAQKLLGDVAASLTLFAAPPFAAGDSIKFLSGGALVTEGVVLAIEPLRTVLKTPSGGTLYISNSKVTSWEVLNDSRKA